MQAGKEVQNLGLEAVTPRRTRLLRAQNLQSFQTAIVDAITGPSQAEPESGVVIVPSRSAATQLRYTIEALTNSSASRFQHYSHAPSGTRACINASQDRLLHFQTVSENSCCLKLQETPLPQVFRRHSSLDRVW